MPESDHRIRLDSLSAFSGEIGLGQDRLDEMLAGFVWDSAQSYVLGVQADGEIAVVNAAFARRLKRTPDELLGQPVWPLLTDTDADALRGLFAESATPATNEFVILNFVDAADHPFTLRCRILASAKAAIIAGEELVEEFASQSALIELNNELATVTRENARKGRELAAALAELKQAQTLLVQTEKMASLGQMTAGIAHEINNPLAFVSANHQTLERDFHDLMALIELVKTALPRIAANDADFARQYSAKAAEIDLGYLSEAIPRKLAVNRDGLERVRQLVLDMRTFSRLDEATWKACDLEEGIAVSLRFLQPLARSHGVEVETHFAPVGDVWCSPAALNQAVSNIVGNAIQASARGGLVSVSTAVRDAEVEIEVVDHGSGIPPEVLGKVFDPFFTTKPPGSGTGLGLSIAHDVVRGHKGRIEISSEPGDGTQVRIRIPYHPDYRSPEH